MPTQSRLGAFQNDKLKEEVIIMDGDSPLEIMIMAQQFICSPGTSLHWFNLANKF